MSTPSLDGRTPDDFYAQALSLSQAYCPSWAEYWPQPVTDADVAQDVGLVMLKLFAQLAGYTAGIENQIPRQRRLAFFQFLNLPLRPPLPAVAPLQFTLQAGRPPRLIPADAAVLMPPEQRIRFQTLGDLLVVPATLTAVVTLIPSQDQFIDALELLVAGQAAPLFVAEELAQRDDPAEQPLGHWFALGDPLLFKPDDSLQEIGIELTGKQLYPEYFGQWLDGALNPLPAQLTPSADGLSLNIRLLRPPSAAARSIEQLQLQLSTADGIPVAAPSGAASADEACTQPPEYWLLVKPAPQVKVLATLAQQQPVITGLRCSFRGKRVLPQQAAYNTLLLDIHNGVHPFGQTPLKDDSFYVRCDAVFAKTGASVRLCFELVDVTTVYPALLSWQFWDGAQWQSMNASPDASGRYRFVDTTHDLQLNAPGGTYIEFQCPAMSATTVAGSRGYWLRATLVAGSYGKPGGLTTDPVTATIDAIPDSILPAATKPLVSQYLNDVAGVNFTYRVDPTEYAPPFIRALQITYSYAGQPASFWCYDAFTLSRFLYSPFKAPPQQFTTCNLGFAPDGFAQHTVGQELTLYVHLVTETLRPRAVLDWQWYDGVQWQDLAVDDGTFGLSRSGVVSFTVPAGMRAAEHLSRVAFWFRIVHPGIEHTIAVYGIYPNVTLAHNAITHVNEVLGSSNEQPNQSFALKSAPVLAGLSLAVIEPAGLDAAIAEPAASSAAERPAGEGLVYRPWREVDSFAFCGPADRVFTLDYHSGRVHFGDGRNGRVPPPGHNNIVVLHYEATQGLAGNVAPHTLTLLRPGMSDIAAVTNPAAAYGGVNGDGVGELERSGAARVKAADSAVDLGDLSTLAAASDVRVAKARASELPVPIASVVDARAANGPRIRVAVLPWSRSPVPYTSPALRNSVGRYLRQRCLATLAERIEVQPPDFVRIDVSVQLAVATAVDQQQLIQQQLAAALVGFLQPVFGGMGTGWDFGEPVTASAISAFLRRQAQVVAVLGLMVNGIRSGNVVLAAHQLPVAGTMTVLAYSTTQLVSDTA